MKIIDIRQRSAEWHAWRSQGVSATSAAVVMGANPDKTVWRLWSEQLGKIPRPDLSMIPQVRLAILLEPHALAWFEERYGVTLLSVSAESSVAPVIRASFDGLTDDNEPVEVKVLSDSNFQDVLEFGEESEHYKLYWWQVQHQMYVSEGSKGYLLFYHTRREPIVFEIARDDAAIDKLVKEELKYWELVCKGKAPAKDPLRDLFMPEGEALANWVAVATEARNLEARRRELAEEAEKIEARQKELQKSFLEMMGDNMLAECEGVRVTRYMQSGRVSWRKIVMLLDPEFSESKYPEHVTGSAERIKITIDGESPVSSATLTYGLGGFDPETSEFCI